MWTCKCGVEAEIEVLYTSSEKVGFITLMGKTHEIYKAIEVTYLRSVCCDEISRLVKRKTYFTLNLETGRVCSLKELGSPIDYMTFTDYVLLEEYDASGKFSYLREYIEIDDIPF